MVDFGKVFSILRLRDYLREQPRERAASRIRGGIQMENLLLENALKRRRLGEPTFGEKELLRQRFGRAKEERGREWDKTKFMFTKLVQIMNDPKTSPADRNHLGMLTQNFYFSQHPKLRAMLAPLAKGSPLDPMEQKLMAFERQYPKPRSPATRYEKGEPIKITQENEGEWAEYKLRLGEWRFKRAVVAHGAPAAKAAFSPPRFVQVLASVGEGENERPGNLWYVDRQTKQVNSVSQLIRQVDLSQAEEWGYPLEVIKSRGFMPTGEPTMGVYAGGKFQVTPGAKLPSGEVTTDLRFYGKEDKDIQALPKSWLSAFAGLALGVDPEKLDKLKKAGISPEAAEVMMLLKDIEGRYPDEKSVQANMKKINEELRMRYPRMSGYTLIYEGGRGPSYLPPWGSNKIKVKGGKWSIIPANSWREITDRFGRPGTVLENTKTKKLYDLEGVELPIVSADLPAPEAPVEEVEFKGAGWKGLRYYPTPEAREKAERAAAKAAKLERKKFNEFIEAIKKGHKAYLAFMNKVFPPYKAVEGEYESVLDYLQKKGIL